MNNLEEQFVDIVEQNQGLIHKVCHLYADTDVDKNDLFQEIVLQLWKAYPNYKGNSKLSTWMYRVALYTAMNELKKRKRHHHLDPMADFLLNDADMKFDVDHINAALALLSASERAIVTLYIDEKSYQEIAQILGISDSNVGVKLNRIKKKLKKLIKV